MRARYLIARAAADLVAEEIRQADTEEIDRLSDAVLEGSASAREAAVRLIKVAGAVSVPTPSAAWIPGLDAKRCFFRVCVARKNVTIGLFRSCSHSIILGYILSEHKLIFKDTDYRPCAHLEITGQILLIVEGLYYLRN